MSRKDKEILEEIHIHIVNNGTGPNAEQFIVDNHQDKDLIEGMEAARIIIRDSYGNYKIPIHELRKLGSWNKDKTIANKFLARLGEACRDDVNKERTIDEITPKTDIPLKSDYIQRILHYLIDLNYIRPYKSDNDGRVESIFLNREILDSPEIDAKINKIEELKKQTFIESAHKAINPTMFARTLNFIKTHKGKIGYFTLFAILIFGGSYSIDKIKLPLVDLKPKSQSEGQKPISLTSVKGTIAQSNQAGDNININNVLLAENHARPPKSKEQLEVRLRIEDPGVKRLIVDVVNMGEIDLFPERASLKCNGKIIGAFSLKHGEYYSTLNPGDKDDDIVSFFAVPGTPTKKAKWGECNGSIKVEITTTRGNVFSSQIKNTIKR